MWYQSFEFYDQHPPATPDDITAFRTPLPEAERTNALNYLDSYATQLSATGYCLPPHFYIPNELMQLWHYSVHGGITGNGQDFGYFSPAETVSYYFGYQFWYYAPNLLPIAFDGGGVFYCYDFGQPGPLIVMKDSGSDDLGVPVGNSLADVLAQELDY